MTSLFKSFRWPLAIAVATAIVIGSALTANAATVAPYNPAPMPTPGVTRTAGINDFSAFVPGVVSYRWNGPRHIVGSANVEASITLQAANAVGGTSYFDLYLQTRVCRFFGCNWKEIAKVENVYVPANGAVNSEILTAPLRRGYNSYRLRLQYSHPVVDIENVVPWVHYESEQVVSWKVEM